MRKHLEERRYARQNTNKALNVEIERGVRKSKEAGRQWNKTLESMN
jgi:hypothetical protein